MGAMFGLGTAPGRKERNLFSNHHHHPQIAKTKLKEVKIKFFRASRALSAARFWCDSC